MNAQFSALAKEQAQKAQRLLDLHTRPQILELHNVWDVTSTQAVATQPHTTAIATASAAIAASHGYEDGENLPWSLHLACVQRICAATDLPVTVDIERGYGDPVATTLDIVQAGAVGMNIEDACCPPAEFARVIAGVRGAADSRGLHLVINARTDEFLLAAQPSIHRAIEAAQAYLQAGADCVFAPGMIEPAHIKAMVHEIGRQRLNLLALPGLPNTPALQHLGVARLSHGPALHNATATFIANWVRE